MSPNLQRGFNFVDDDGYISGLLLSEHLRPLCAAFEPSDTKVYTLTATLCDTSVSSLSFSLFLPLSSAWDLLEAIILRENRLSYVTVCHFTRVAAKIENFGAITAS